MVYHDPATWGPDIHPVSYIVMSSCALALTTTAVALRVYVRTVMTNAFGFDDLLVLFAYVSTTPQVTRSIVTDVRTAHFRYTVWPIHSIRSGDQRKRLDTGHR